MFFDRTVSANDGGYNDMDVTCHLGTTLAGQTPGDSTMSDIFAIGTGLVMTALAVGAGGIALEALLLIVSRALQTRPSTHREFGPVRSMNGKDLIYRRVQL